MSTELLGSRSIASRLSLLRLERSGTAAKCCDSRGWWMEAITKEQSHLCVDDEVVVLAVPGSFPKSNLRAIFSTKPYAARVVLSNIERSRTINEHLKHFLRFSQPLKPEFFLRYL
jgi:hypothetical protein